MFRRRTPCMALIAAAAALIACENGPSAAQPVAPIAAEEETGASEAYVREESTDALSLRIVVPAAVRALPGVGERIVADAEQRAANVTRRAEERRREGAAGSTPWGLAVDWSVVFDDAGVLSAVGATQIEEGIAPRVETYETILFDRGAAREVSFAELFADPRPGGAAMRAVSDAAFAAWTEQSPHVGDDLSLVDERVLVDARETLRPRASSFESFAVVPASNAPGRASGVMLFYPPGALGLPGEGGYRLFISAAPLADHLSDRWRSVFALEAAAR